LDQVAKMAGVSPSTVSRILNGTATVSQEKATAVANAIETLGFVPNPIARGLAGGRTMSVGVVTHVIDSPFYGPALRSIEDTLDTAGYNALFASAKWDAGFETRSIETLRSRRVDGLIILSGRISNDYIQDVARFLPVVVTGRSMQGERVFALNFDNFSGAVMATQHLIELGHRQIAFINGDAGHLDTMERLRGYRHALASANLAFDPDLVIQGDYQEPSGVAAIETLLATKTHFTAVFAANDQMAYGAALELHRRSIRIPQDVSVMGFDDLPHSAYAAPPLTTIEQPAAELGRLAAQSILQLLAGEQPTSIVQTPKLIVRASTTARKV
jgi:LacI family transcriptional regulator